jgi:hypothetical protein
MMASSTYRGMGNTRPQQRRGRNTLELTFQWGGNETWYVPGDLISKPNDKSLRYTDVTNNTVDLYNHMNEEKHACPTNFRATPDQTQHVWSMLRGMKFHACDYFREYILVAMVKEITEKTHHRPDSPRDLKNVLVAMSPEDHHKVFYLGAWRPNFAYDATAAYMERYNFKIRYVNGVEPNYNCFNKIASSTLVAARRELKIKVVGNRAQEIDDSTLKRRRNTTKKGARVFNAATDMSKKKHRSAPSTVSRNSSDSAVSSLTGAVLEMLSKASYDDLKSLMGLRDTYEEYRAAFESRRE